MSRALQVASIPTMALFATGQEVARRSGALLANWAIEWASAAAA
jgi:thioredoxin-like negative regulator of GroEL